MQVWYIRLFGSLGVGRDQEEITRFSTRKTGALLAYLAFYRGRRHGREALCDLLWPDEPPATSRARLRVALTSLRHQLEPPGVPGGTVIRSDGHDYVQIVAEAVATDVAEVESALQLLDSDTASLDERAAASARIVALFRHPLLTGMYEDWVLAERERLSQAAVERLAALARKLPPETGIELARHAAHLDPLAEEPLFALLPLLAQSGQASAARRAYEAFRRRWEAEMGGEPSPALAELAASLQVEGGKPVVASVGQPAPPGRTETPVATAPTTAAAASVPPRELRRLPLYLTRFFGREAERVAVRNALSDSRLVTLTGPGGTGKTRLAVEAAGDWDGACWFVPLADLSDAERFPAAVCDALGEAARRTRAATGADTPEALLAGAAAALTNAPRPLLVLDNLEQIADQCGSWVVALLERVPELRLLVTSRLRLHIPGERELPVDPLPTPPVVSSVAVAAGPAAEDDLEATAAVASVALFLDRARAARPDFQITPRNRGDIVEVCRLLEGIPLALELVAARGGTLVPAQMRAQLAAAGSLLVTDRRAAPDDRHRSLYAAIDWSYRLLPEDLRHTFRHLAVFRGGFTAAAAAAVCGIPEDQAAEALARLRAHSLVGSVADAAEMRFSLLESLRVFAAAQLAADEEAPARRRHLEWFASLAELADQGLSGPEQAMWLDRLEADQDNLRAALEAALASSPQTAGRMAGAIWLFWHLRARPGEGRRWLEAALARSAAERPGGDGEADAVAWRARALHGAGTLAWVQGDGAAAAPLFEESLRLRRMTGDWQGTAATLNNLGLLAWSRRDLEAARGFHAEALAIRRERGDRPAQVASSLHNLGVVNWDRGDYPAARAAAEEALAICREAGDRVGEAHALNNLGNVALALGDFEAAEAWYDQSLAVKRTLGYAPGIAATLSNVGVTALRQGRLDVAEARFREALGIYREMDALEGITTQLRNLGQIATERGDWAGARAFLLESLALRLSSDSPGDIAGNLEAFAILAAAPGDAARAARLLGAAAARRAESGIPLHPSEQVPVERAAAAARAVLGEDAFRSHYSEGEAAPPDAAVALAREV